MKKKRQANDYYQTPISCIKKLLPHLDLSNINRFLEPCKGRGNIYDLIPAKNKDFCEIREGRDYLDTRFRKRFDLIITNPPFSMWRPFLQKSLSEADTVIYLLRINNLGSGKTTKRADFWNANKPSHLFPIEDRPSFVHGATDMTDYAFFCWDRAGIVTTNHWLNVI